MVRVKQTPKKVAIRSNLITVTNNLIYCRLVESRIRKLEMKKSRQSRMLELKLKRILKLKERKRATDVDNAEQRSAF